MFSAVPDGRTPLILSIEDIKYNMTSSKTHIVLYFRHFVAATIIGSVMVASE